MAAAGRELADKRIPVLIVAVSCVLAWAIGTVSREPWPFPIFPGFGTVPAGGAAAEPDVRRVFVILGDDQPTFVDLRDMFPGATDSFHQQMTESFVSINSDASASPSDGVDNDLAQWVNARAQDRPTWSGGCVKAIELVELTAEDQQVGSPLQRIEFPSCP